jgi:hypothetical protein
MRSRAYLLLLAAALGLAAAPALADTTRTCRAHVKAFTGNKSEIIATIEGVGHCANKHHANDCRIRARKAIEACIAALKPAGTENALPLECRSYAGGGRPYAALTYEGILTIANAQNYLNRLAHSACCRLAPSKDAVTLSVNASKWGKNHCAGDRIGKDHYQDDNVFVHGPLNFDCKKRRAQGVCG